MSKKLGNMIREARTAKGLTQAALAEQAGITSSEVGKIERGEKEPDQAVLKLMAKTLGVTRKSLLESAAVSGSASGKKTSSSGKTDSGKTASGKTVSAGKAGKTSASGKTGKTSSASKTAANIGTLTATEKKLVQLYRKADSGTKKAAMQLLSGDGNLLEILAPIVLGKKDVSSNMSSMASGLFESILSGKTGPQAADSLKRITEETP